jgi:hypothetical protein
MKSDSKKPLRAKRRKVEETTATTSQQSVLADYTHLGILWQWD